MRVHRLTFAALAVAAGLSLTACQNDNAGDGTERPVISVHRVVLGRRFGLG